jgi:hypothetical protein
MVSELGTLQQHVAEAFAECNETRKLLMSWRDARQAIFDHTFPSEEGHALFAELATAEHNLMAYARQYQPRHQ